MFEKPLYSPVSSKGQVVLPSSLRKKLNIKKGSILHFNTISNNCFVVKIIDDNQTNAITVPEKGSKVQSIGLKKTFK